VITALSVSKVVHRYGGRTLVQDEATSHPYAMPATALAEDSPDPPIALDDLPAAITAIVEQRASRQQPPSDVAALTSSPEP
jgi:chemotaxis response regulator CheB